MDEETPLSWKYANKLMSEASYISMKIRDADVNGNNGRLAVAYSMLEKKGEKQYKKSIEIVSRLNKRDSEIFWTKQSRNKNAKCFKDLITKREIHTKEL